MRNHESLCDLLFELSSTNRMKILIELSQNPMILSQVSKTQGMTVSEASRHLNRLTDANIIKKEIEGRYSLTSFGKTILRMMPAVDFLNYHREYFSEHDLTILPAKFVARIGEVSDGDLGTDVMSGFHLTDLMLDRAEKNIWIMSNQILMSTLPIINRKSSEGVEFRSILPKDITPPEGFNLSTLREEIQSQSLRLLDRVEVVLILTEKEATFSLSDNRGKIDYLGFYSKASGFLTWVRDLFLYYWDLAKPSYESWLLEEGES